jgi:hypothetical protein
MRYLERKRPALRASRELLMFCAMPDLTLRPSEYRDLAREPVRYSPLEYLSFWIASRWATQQRDEEFEGQQMTALVYGVGTFLVHKFKSGV